MQRQLLLNLLPVEAVFLGQNWKFSPRSVF